MSAPVTEMFTGGLVTARHPALLSEGELQRADDTVYRIKDPAIWRAPGRTALCAAFSAAQDPSSHGVKGIAHLSFEGTRTDQIVAYIGTTLFRAPFTGINATPANTLTFVEMGGPASVDGTATGTAFVATTGFPFLIDVIGSRVFTATAVNLIVTAVSGQSGSTGHYNTITLSAAAPANGAVTYAFEIGCVQTLQDNGATDEILETLQYGAQYFAWFGRGNLTQIQWKKRQNIGTGATGGTALDDVLSFRPVGLLPVETAPTIERIIILADGTTPAWAPTLGTGYFWFLITEIGDPKVKGNPGADEIEGAYLAKDTEKQSVGDPVPIQITSVTGQGVKLTMPAVRNTGKDGRLATHWGIYMAGPTQDPSTAPSMATFRRVALRQMTQTAAGQTIELSDSRFTQPLYVSVNKGGADGRAEMSNSARVLGPPDDSYATTKSGSGTSGSEQDVGVTKFGFGSNFVVAAPWATRSIIGIQVQVTGAADPSGNAGRIAGYYVYLTDGTKTSPAVFGEFGSKDMHANYHGAEMDTWGTNFVTADLDTDFSVVIGKSGSGSRQRLRIDAVRVTIYFVSGTLNLLGVPYRVVSYRDQVGVTINQPAAGLPSEMSTGDFFQGCFVQNDKGDETAIHFSLPGKPEWMPGPYVMRFNTTKRKDIVTYVKTVGQVLIVGMQNSVKRVNYLPREINTDLGDGLAHEDLTVDHGIVGPLAAGKFDMPAAGTMLFYVATNGVWITDGVTSTPANQDLDWSNTVNLSALSSCVVRVYPKERWITLDYCPAGATHSKNTRRLVFSYSSEKIKEGGFLPCTGPLTVSGRSSCEVTYSGTTYLFSGHEADNKIYLEDYGVTQSSGYQVYNAAGTLTSAPILPLVRTRKFYPAGIEMDTYGERVYVLFTAYGSAAVTATGTPVSGSTTVTSAAAFGSVLPGMHLTGLGIDGGTIVLQKIDSSTIIISRAANSDAATGTLTFDTGTLGITIRGSGIYEAVLGLQTVYGTTLTGDLLSLHAPEMREGFELQFEKVPLTFDSNHDTATWADLDTNMRLHQFTYVVTGQGREQTRAAN